LLQQIVGEDAPKLPTEPVRQMYSQFPNRLKIVHGTDVTDWMELCAVVDQCLIKDVSRRPSPQQLMVNSFILIVIFVFILIPARSICRSSKGS
jgi:hypothetical protein